jgi:hypothetical protein
MALDRGEQMQIDLLRKATIAQRFGLARSLTATTRRMARQALRRAHPEWSGDDLDVAFVELLYGPKMAAGFRARLTGRRIEASDG